MIKVGVDEFTVCLLLADKDKLKSRNWNEIAEMIINIIESVLMLEDVFGERTITTTNNINGYNIGVVYGCHPFYFRICYHSDYWHMGVAIRFSAQSLAFYMQRYAILTGEHIEAYNILQILNSSKLGYTTMRLSRIDFCADYINEGLSVEKKKKKLNSGSYHLEYSTGKKNTSKISGMVGGGVTDTVYIGSSAANIDSRLRIYNKRKEQIDMHGSRYDEAVNCNNWIRMENVIRHDYAHSLTDALMAIDNDADFAALIATCLLNKYTFKNSTGHDCKMTKLLRKVINKPAGYYFTKPKYKDLSLSESLYHLTKNSGLIPFLYKLKAFDKNGNAINLFIDYIGDKLNTYIPNRDTQTWMNHHSQYYSEHGIEEVFESSKRGKRCKK